MLEAISYFWETCRNATLCAYNEKNYFVPSSWSPSEQEGAEFNGIWENYFLGMLQYIWDQVACNFCSINLNDS